MTNHRLGELLEEHYPGLRVEGGRGAWQIKLPPPAAEPKPEQGDEARAPEAPGADGHLPPVVIVLTDERADRMRIMMPIRSFDPDKIDDLRLALIALHANYDRALDARYATQDGVLWSVFIHPLGSLSKADLTNALQQVQTLRDSTGTTYSSSDLIFGPAIAPEEPAKDEPTEDDPSAA